MKRVVFLSEAFNDIEEASRWYAGQNVLLDVQFLEHIFSAIETLQNEHVGYKAKHKGLSRILVKKFPYSIYFRKDITKSVIIIFGVLHMKQDRSHLRKRKY